MTTQQTVSVSGLGICEHCGVVVTIENMPADSMDAKWTCPKCNGELTGKTFGYEKIDGKWKKARWVGPEGKWVETEPTEDFNLGNFFVVSAHHHGQTLPIYRY